MTLEKIEELAEIYAEAVAWTRAEGLIAGFLAGYFEHIEFWQQRAQSTGIPLPNLLAGFMTQGLIEFLTPDNRPKPDYPKLGDLWCSLCDDHHEPGTCDSTGFRRTG